MFCFVKCVFHILLKQPLSDLFPSAAVQLLKDIGNMFLHRSLRDTEILRDLPVAHPLADQQSYLALPPCEPLPPKNIVALTRRDLPETIGLYVFFLSFFSHIPRKYAPDTQTVQNRAKTERELRHQLLRAAHALHRRKAQQKTFQNARPEGTGGNTLTPLSVRLPRLFLSERRQKKNPRPQQPDHKLFSVKESFHLKSKQDRHQNKITGNGRKLFQNFCIY